MGTEKNGGFKRISRMFSKKQAYSIGNSYKNLNNWFIKNGEPPVLLNDELTKQTQEKLKIYYANHGYFKANISANVRYEPKKAVVEYHITKNRPYRLDSITTEIKNSTLKNIYNKKNKTSYIKKGQIFNLKRFKNEARRVKNLFRNQGIYKFNDSHIGFYNIDTARADFKTPVTIKIGDADNNKSNKTNFNVFKISKVNIISDYSYKNKDLSIKDSAHYNNQHFYSYQKSRYRPKSLSEHIFIHPDSIYSDNNNQKL